MNVSIYLSMNMLISMTNEPGHSGESGRDGAERPVGPAPVPEGEPAQSDPEVRHARRTRYRGTHPRHFSEKYKEHRAAEYPADIERVKARGATPAGSHRPICVREVLACLTPRPGEVAVDATLGYGGHALELLRALGPTGRLLGLDRDAIELGRTRERLSLAEGGAFATAFLPVHASFADLPSVLAASGLGCVDLLLADLGLSSMQIDDPERGFSFKRRGPLDMRMDRSKGPPAAAWLRYVEEGRLAGILRDNADEVEAEAVAREICRRRGRLATTRDLAEAVCAAFPDLRFEDPGMRKILTRVFQAIRIEVNGEFSALAALLAALPDCLAPGGRAAFLCFHSGEERRVVAALEAGLASGTYSVISAEPIRPGREERNSNPRSASARLLWAIAAGLRQAAGASNSGKGTDPEVRLDPDA
jgi:16S rRNA (cytosine1402-N4)-methyltransferase